MTAADPARGGALDGLRVVELAGRFGNYSGKLFRDLGAEVILVEPPGGAPGRSTAPLAQSGLGLRFAYDNAGKRSVILDLSADAGRQAFRRLIATADLLLESEPPGALAALGLSFDELVQLRPSLVMTSITGFGQDGPRSAWQADDLIASATSGMMSLAGYRDSAPLIACGQQAELAAHCFAAVASLAAVFAAEASGEGERIDVSIQECMVMGLENAVQFVDLEGFVRGRHGGEQPRAGTGVFACLDGHVYLMSAGVGASRFWRHTLDWLASEGAAVSALAGPQWEQDAFLATDEAKTIFADAFGTFAATRSKHALCTTGQAHRVPIAPVRTLAEVLADPQLAYRGFFRPLPAGLGIGDSAMPGAPYRLSATPWSAADRVLGRDEHGAALRRLAVDPARLEDVLGRAS
jgi:benzylsuccinate CoA-transferase BbsE subunit